LRATLRGHARVTNADVGILGGLLALLSSACATIEPPAVAVRSEWGVARASTEASARRLSEYLALVAPEVVARIPGLSAAPIDARFVSEMHDIPSFTSSLHGSYHVNGVTLRNRYDRWIEEPERGDAILEKRVLAHELVHFWIGPDWDPLPHFLEEGLAENAKDSVVPRARPPRTSSASCSSRASCAAASSPAPRGGRSGSASRPSSTIPARSSRSRSSTRA
jgi:hypothetical protein